MQYSDLRDFIALLEQRGELVRIKQPVSPHLEITEITDRVCKGPAQLNKALLFESLPGYQMPLLINAMASPDTKIWSRYSRIFMVSPLLVRLQCKPYKYLRPKA